jgi:hypothetical protein
MSHVTIRMPLELTGDMLRAVRDDPTTSVEDREQWHTRLGWLLCAWDVLVKHRLTPKELQGRQEFEEEIRQILATTPNASDVAIKVANLVY